MRKNLPLWAVTLDSWWLSADLGLLKGSGAAPREAEILHILSPMWP